MHRQWAHHVVGVCGQGLQKERLKRRALQHCRQATRIQCQLARKAQTATVIINKQQTYSCTNLRTLEILKTMSGLAMWFERMEDRWRTMLYDKNLSWSAGMSVRLRRVPVN